MFRKARPYPRTLCLAVAMAAVFVASLIGASASSAATPIRGVQLHSLWSDSSAGAIERDLDASRDLGANTVRLDVGWSSLETDGKGQFSDTYVRKLDRFIDAADARGIKTIITLWSTPCWASSAPESLKQGCDGTWWDRGVVAYPPTNPRDYGDISRWVTSRYGSKLAALEVWNEPNFDQRTFWKTDDEAGDYVKLLRAAYPAAKAGNASVPVLGGSLSTADRPFLERMYAAGAKGYFDGISIHPYNEWRDPADMWQEQYRKHTLIRGTEWVREAQLAAGDRTPLWITEYGWSSCTGMRWCISEAQQADYTARSVKLIAEKLPYVKAALVYNLRDQGNSKTRMDDNFGLVRSDWAHKPAFSALKAAWSGRQADPAPTIVVHRKAESFVVRGRAPANTVIKLRLVRCARRCKQVRSKGAKRKVKVGKSGRFRTKLGRLGRRHKGRVKLNVVRPRRSGRAA